MADTVEEISRACSDLRVVQADVLARMPQAQVVSLLSEWARVWRESKSPWRREAEALTDPFPFAMTRVSLDALLESLTPDGLWELIDAEGVRDSSGAALIGHVIAGNTPLLAWVSILRALLMRSASLVKLPSGMAAGWGRLFLHTLSDLSPTLASGVHLSHWPGGTIELDAALCRNVDLVAAYGGAETIHALEALCHPGTDFLGYGHRVSFGLVPKDANLHQTAQGLARDVLLYDQGGCLSPHTVFVEGNPSRAEGFAAQLADALRNAVDDFPLTPRTPQAAMRVREVRALARMEADTRIWEDSGLRWTVVAKPETAFVVSPTYCVITVQPLENVEALSSACAPVAGHLQGCAVAASQDVDGFIPWRLALEALGVSRICRPGQLQAPPYSWREDGRDVLASLVTRI